MVLAYGRSTVGYVRSTMWIDKLADAHLIASPDVPADAFLVVACTQAMGSRPMLSKFIIAAAKKGAIL